MADARAHERPEHVPTREDEDDLVLGELRKSASFAGDSSAHMVPVWLSRRGWALLIAAVGAAAIVLLIISAVAIKSPASHARAESASTSPQPSSQAATVNPEPTDQPSPSPTASDVPTVPTRPVSTLTTGDCLQTYPSQWANGYPVVDCTAPHIAQVLSTGDLPQPSDAPFPGSKALDDQASGLCNALDLVDWNWVGIWNEDVLVAARYPDTDTLWASGARTYYCFIYTSSRHELTDSAIPSP